jgi:hypothetical protein
MRRIFILLLILPGNCNLQAQTLKEWFQQADTQKDYLLEQIAGLKIYLGLTKKGYQIARTGLTNIGDIKRGEFNLHKNRFDSLLIVKPVISSLSRLREITDMHGTINQICRKLAAQLKSESTLNAGQLAYVGSALDHLYADCQAIIGNLFVVIRHGNVSMTDDDRIQRINLCHSQMQQNYIFALDFQQQVWLLSAQTKNERLQIQGGLKLHGLN